jgi:hypothetical protein
MMSSNSFSSSRNNRNKSSFSKSASASANKTIYNKILITRKIPLSITNVGNNILNTIKNTLVQQLEGKCVVEGYIRPGSVIIQNYSSGELYGAKVLFDVVIECDVCSPVEGMEIECIAKNITKAGIRAEIEVNDNNQNNQKMDSSPVVIFLARDHHKSPYFTTVKLNDKINVRVIGQRFELNDKYVSVIAELIEPDMIKKNKLKIVE